jgi:two-component system, LytTR family, response regulator
MRKRHAHRVSTGHWILPTAVPPAPSPAPYPERRLRAVLADPDPFARRHLRQLLEAEPGLAIIAECDRAETARAVVRRERPDLLFLELVLPDADGLALAGELAPDLRGGVVFVTALRHGALYAYDLHALGYLLKPVDQHRLRAEAAHLRSLLLSNGHETGAVERLVELLDRREAEQRRRSRLPIKHSDGAVFIRTDTIDWLEAEGKVVKVHVGKQVYPQREALAHLERQLPADQFVRISRSAIVNLDRIREIQPWFHGELLVILGDDSQVPTSRHYRAHLRRLLGKSAEP